MLRINPVWTLLALIKIWWDEEKMLVRHVEGDTLAQATKREARKVANCWLILNLHNYNIVELSRFVHFLPIQSLKKIQDFGL